MYFRSRSETLYQVILHVIVVIVAVSAVFPLIYVLGMSLTTQPELIARHYFVIIPHEPTLEAYRRIITSPLIWNSFLISVTRSVVGPLLTLTFTLIGAYVLSHRTLPGRNALLFFILATILFGGGLIPTYLVVKDLHLIDSLWSLIIPGLVDSFGLLVIKIFIENLPDGLMDSAKIDGAGEIQTLIHVVIPLAAPALAAIGLFGVVGHWNSWFDALIYLNDANKYPLQLILKNMLTGQVIGDQFRQTILQDSTRITPESMKMATVIFGIVPILCVYPFLQKHFIKGMYLGAVKG